MSDASLVRIVLRAMERLPEYVVSGRGADLLVEAYEAGARDLAETVFLGLDDLVRAGTTQDEVNEHVSRFHLGIVHVISSIHDDFGLPAEWIKATEKRVSRAYVDRMGELFTAPNGGGAA